MHTDAPPNNPDLVPILWTGRSRNPKTDDIPQGYIGTVEQAKESCTGCPIRKLCYHWHGSSQMAHHSITKSYLKNPDSKSLDNALSAARKDANYIRLGVGGDPCVLTRQQVAEVHRKALDQGLKGALAYTHFAKTKAKHLHGLALASCGIHQADELIDLGWRVAIDLPFRAPGVKKHKQFPEWDGQPITTPAGRPINICDAQTTKHMTCNKCGKCDPFDLRYILAIGFLLH